MQQVTRFCKEYTNMVVNHSCATTWQKTMAAGLTERLERAMERLSCMLLLEGQFIAPIVRAWFSD